MRVRFLDGSTQIADPRGVPSAPAVRVGLVRSGRGRGAGGTLSFSPSVSGCAGQSHMPTRSPRKSDRELATRTTRRRWRRWPES